MSDEVKRAAERALRADAAATWRRVSRSGWGEAWSLGVGDRRYFVKTAAGDHADTLSCEADGLRALAATSTLRVPSVVTLGMQGDAAFLILEWLRFRSGGGARLGLALARLHAAPLPRAAPGARFGWHRDNWIGGSRQPNGWSDDWCAFFRDRRLAPQLARATANGFGDHVADDGRRALDALASLLRNHAPEASLLHGDLWSGNAGVLDSGECVVFDPAVYVGDREVDVAMSELFGGFGDAFAVAYRRAWPLAAGYEVRRDVYNLYHLLNHLNLFGAAYLPMVKQSLARIVRVTH